MRLRKENTKATRSHWIKTATMGKMKEGKAMNDVKPHEDVNMEGRERLK